MTMSGLRVIVTAPPYSNFLHEVAAHPIVGGLRLNTVMPLNESPGEALMRLRQFEQPIWIDLKARQLRVVGAAIPPYTEVRISHQIHVDTPVDAFFSDGTEKVRIVGVDGDRLILADGPRRLIGPGESLNIVHPSLEVLGLLTERDMMYLRAMNTLGMRKVMLSFVERQSDITAVTDLLPDAEIVLKIETQKGLSFARQHDPVHGQLLAARGDLYVELTRPHHIVRALEEIIQADPDAMVASRILDSLAFHPVPASADISDVGFLWSLGYRTFVLGDALCLQRDSVMEALNLLEILGTDFA